MGVDFVSKQVRKTDSVFVHGSRVHAYFSVIWVFVYFVLLCGLVKAVILDFLYSSEALTKQDIGDSGKEYNSWNRWLQKLEARMVMQSFNQHQFLRGENDELRKRHSQLRADSPDGVLIIKQQSQSLRNYSRAFYGLVEVSHSCPPPRFIFPSLW